MEMREGSKVEERMVRRGTRGARMQAWAKGSTWAEEGERREGKAGFNTVQRARIGFMMTKSTCGTRACYFRVHRAWTAPVPPDSLVRGIETLSHTIESSHTVSHTAESSLSLSLSLTRALSPFRSHFVLSLYYI